MLRVCGPWRKMLDYVWVAVGGALGSPPWFRQQFFMLGICGGYTTFSSFSLQTLNLVEDGQWLYAGANVIISVVSCLVAVWLGHLLATAINATPR